MKFSVITVCRNAMPYIQHCVTSVADEMKRHPGLIEHVVIDGASTDDTGDYLRTQPHLRLVSEPDQGISDAMNKGLAIATGDVILFLNADDELVEGALPAALHEFKRDPSRKWVQGHVAYIDPAGTLVGRQRAHERLLPGLRRSTKFNQQAALMHRDIFDSIGQFSTAFHYVMDYDFWLRTFREFPPFCVDLDIARYRMHTTNRSRANVWESEYEKHLVRMKNRDVLQYLTNLESLLYVGATYYRSPTVAHYIAIGFARRNEIRAALHWCAKNYSDKPFQTPEHLICELTEIIRARRRCRAQGTSTD